MNTFLHSVAFGNIAKKKAIWKKMELCWNFQFVGLSTETRITWIQSWLGMSSWILGNSETDVDAVEYFKSVSWFTRTRRKIYCPSQALAEKLWFLTWFFLSLDLSHQFYLSLSQFSVSKGLNLSDLGNISQKKKNLPTPLRKRKSTFREMPLSWRACTRVFWISQLMKLRICHQSRRVTPLSLFWVLKSKICFGRVLECHHKNVHSGHCSIFL